MYYKISVNAGEFSSYEYMEAENEEKAKKALEEMVRDFKDDPNEQIKKKDIRSSIREVSIDECIAEEEFMRTLDMERLYVQLRYDFDTITVGEYGRLQKAMRNDPRTKWLMLKDLNGLHRQYSLLEKTCDLQKMPVAVYKETARKLLRIVDMGESGRADFEKVFMEVCRQYGKEPFRSEAEQDKTCPRNEDDGVIQ